MDPAMKAPSVLLLAARAAAAASLEERGWGVWRPLDTSLERCWARVASRTLRRPLRVPSEVAVVAIGGATLGGSGKTPTAIACARVLAERSRRRIALVGHAYGATPREARVVRPGDELRVVGDEALLCARALSGARVDVVVGPTRQLAADLAVARGADVLILDGALQVAPRRAELSILVVDAERPWGRGACPPRGDLRAPPSALLEAADHVLRLGERERTSRGALRPDGRLVPFDDLARRRVGLAVTLARPERLLVWLAAKNVRPRRVVRGVDHRGFPPDRLAAIARDGEVDVWLTSSKCSIHLECLREERPDLALWPLDFAVELPEDTRAVLAQLGR